MNDFVYKHMIVCPILPCNMYFPLNVHKNMVMQTLGGDLLTNQYYVSMLH